MGEDNLAKATVAAATVSEWIREKSTSPQGRNSHSVSLANCALISSIEKLSKDRVGL